MNNGDFKNLVHAKRALVLVVNYNQEFEIEPVLLSLRDSFPIESVIVVDDGSNDRSPEIARTLGFHVIQHSRNRGVGAAIRTGIEYGRANDFGYITIMSSNGKMRINDLSTVLLPLLEDRAEYVTGSRFIKGGSSPGLSFFRRLAIPIFSLCAWPIIGRRFSDITCGYRSYSLALFDDPRLQIGQEWLDSYEMEYYIHYWACRLPIRIIEVPVVIPYSHLAKRRKSKITPIIGWWSMIRPFVYLSLGIKR